MINAACPSANGSINLTPFNGTAPYTFAWSNGATIEDISSLADDLYEVTVTDASGCEAIASILVGCGSENCNNGLDDDGDGFIDYYDSDCPCDNSGYFFGNCVPSCDYIPPSGSNGFDLITEWIGTTGVTNISQLFVGDMDGDPDDVPEIVAMKAMSYDASDINAIYILNGADGSLKYHPNTLRYHNRNKGLAVGDVDRDGRTEFFYVTAADEATGNATKIACYEYNPAGANPAGSGTGTFDLQWVSNQTVTCGLSVTDQPYTEDFTVSLVDFNYDGVPEVYVGNDIFNAQTGAKIATGGANSIGSWNAGEFTSSFHVMAVSVAVDVLPDAACADCSGLELVAGNQVYSVNIGTGTMTVQRTAPNSLPDGNTAIADYDLDGDLDAVITSNDANSSFLYIWDLQTNTQIGNTHTVATTSSLFYHPINTPIIADFDGDNRPEIGVCGNLVFQVVEDHLTNISGTGGTLWNITTTDNSGQTGASVFDFNGDGVPEVVYRDESELRVISGPTGTNLATFPCGSGTGGEYPVIADIDNDGETEIVCNCSNSPGASSATAYTTAFRSDNFPWVPTRKLWNQYAYFNVNINDDLTIPQQQQTHHNVGSPALGTTGALNTFLKQASPLDKNGDRIFPAADLTTSTLVDGTLCLINGTVALNINIANNGQWTAPANVPISIYETDPTSTNATFLGSVTTTNSIAVGSSITASYTLDVSTFSFPKTVFVIVNDDNSATMPYDLSTDFPVTSIAECDFTNNKEAVTIATGCILIEICNDGLDNDGDGLIDCEDPDCYLSANSGDIDSDGDGIGDGCDIDDDNDGILDCAENYACQSSSDLSSLLDGQLNSRTFKIVGCGFPSDNSTRCNLSIPSFFPSAPNNNYVISGNCVPLGSVNTSANSASGMPNCSSSDNVPYPTNSTSSLIEDIFVGTDSYGFPDIPAANQAPYNVSNGTASTTSCLTAAFVAQDVGLASLPCGLGDNSNTAADWAIIEGYVVIPPTPSGTVVFRLNNNGADNIARENYMSLWVSDNQSPSGLKFRGEAQTKDLITQNIDFTVPTTTGLISTPLSSCNAKIRFVRLYYFDNYAGGSVSLNWSLDGGSTFALVPTANVSSLFPTVCDDDGDNVPNSLDIDADNDGITDLVEAQGTAYVPLSGVDADNDGLDDAFDNSVGSDPILSAGLTAVNLDGTGKPNYLDIDADDDGIPDNIEGQTTAGYIPPSGIDSDGDGLDDAYDNNLSSNSPILSVGIPPVNTDNQDNVDYLDTDSDNDGTLDIAENGDTDNVLSGTDTDNDGLDDNFDTDNVNWDVNDNINDPNPSTLGDADGDVAANGNNAVGMTKDVDYRDGVAPALSSITGTVFEDINYGGGNGRTYTAANTSAQSSGWSNNAIAVPSARVELYDNTGAFVTSTTTNASGQYTFSSLTNGDYSVRVVNSTISSNRASNSTGKTIIPSQTFRATASSNIINEVGGVDPAKVDASSNTTNAALTSLTTASTIAQSVTSVTVGGAGVTGIDFGYNYNVITNTNNDGQGSLRQFILNSNELANTNLDQEDSPTGGVSFPKEAGSETSIFMIPGNSTHTIQPTSILDNITDSKTHISGYTQSGSSQGTISGRTLNIELEGNSSFDGIRVYADDVQISGLTLHSFYKGIRSFKPNSTNTFVWGNYIGVQEDGTTAADNVNNSIEYKDVSNSFIGTNGDNVNDGNEGNLIARGYGRVVLDRTDNVLVGGNYIGIDKTGNVGLNSTFIGVAVYNATGTNYIGYKDDATNTNASHFRNVISGNGTDGIRISNSDNQVVAGNYIGTNATGLAAIGNGNFGVQLLGAVNNNIIGTNSNGDSDILERNIMSGNDGGFRTSSSSSGTGNKIQGNYIGTDVTGNVALQNNNHGLLFSGNASNTLVGTNGDGVNDNIEGNVISGNDNNGIRLETNNNTIAGNKIGVGADGTTVLGNGERGIFLSTGATNNIIGYSSTMTNTDELIVGNQIKNNTTHGISLDNTVGTGNRISRNQIADNGGLGIDLNHDGVSPNDNGDADNGANNRLNFPVITSSTLVGNNLTIKGFAPAGSTIEFFIADAGSSPSPLPGGYTTSFGEGAVYLFDGIEGSGSDLDATTDTYTNDGTGASTTKTQNQFEFTFNVAGLGLTTSTKITSTARDGSNNTSEFSGVTTISGAEICGNNLDDDGDGLTDCEDPDCYLAANTGGTDTDGDGINDHCDIDDDNDGILDIIECNGVTNTVVFLETFGTVGAADNGTDCNLNNPPNATTNPYYSLSLSTTSTADATYLNGPYSTGYKNGTITDNVFGVITDSGDDGDGLLRHNTDVSGGLVYKGIAWRNLNPITVLPNKDYTFSYFVQGGNNSTPQLQVQLDSDGSDGANNFTNIGTSYSAIGTNPIWIKKSVTFNSGSSTSIYLAIYNDQENGNGNDFSLDQISLAHDGCSLDTDNDGIADYLDIDSDNDGITDLVESQGNSVTVPSGIDADNDGLDDAFDNNPNNIDPILSAGTTPINSDGTGSPDYLDIDADDDGITDLVESQGVYIAPSGNDIDGDGLDDAYDNNTNNHDPILSAGIAPINTDGTGNPNYIDIDADDDGITDLVESQGTYVAPSGNDIDNDGLDDAYDNNTNNTNPEASVGIAPINSDGTGNPNYIDIDADDDGIPDNIEGQTTANYNPPSGTDSDGDGLDDAYDNNLSSPNPVLSAGIAPVNTDSQDNVDYLDQDSDNDNIPDIQENGDTDNTLSGTDTDNDGLDDNFDTDNVTWDVNDNINDPNPATLGDADGDVAADGNNAVPMTGDVDYRDGSSPEICNDGVDNDLDGDTDLDDSDCLCNPTSQIPIWVVDEDTGTDNLHLWSFTDYSNANTGVDYGRLKYYDPSTSTVRDAGDANDMEALAINTFTGEAYFFSSSRANNGPSNSQALFKYNLNDAAANQGNIVLTLVGHITRPNSWAMEALAFDPNTNRFYTADPMDGDGNSSSSTDNLYYIDLATLNANPLVVTAATLVGPISGISETNNYVDGLEFDGNGNLFAIDGTDDKLYQINPSTGAITAIIDNNLAGGTGHGSIDIETICWDEGSQKMIALNNNHTEFIELDLTMNGNNTVLMDYLTTSGMPSSADMEGSAMFDACAPRMSLGNLVFKDNDNNDAFTNGEGIDDVIVELYQAGANVSTASPLLKDTTSGGGFYLFENIQEGDYFVHIPANEFANNEPLFGLASIRNYRSG